MTAIKRLSRSLCLLFTALFVVLALGAALTVDTAAENLRYGSTGSKVREVQQLLKNWGYYTGSVDGIYGSKTKAAVVYFQKKNGLVQDGIVGPATYRALGISSGSTSTTAAGYSDSDLRLLANIISAEARGESYAGQVAVGAVVLNRVKHPSFPNTIAGVIYQSGAFTAVTDGQINQSISDSAYSAARDAMNGWDPSGGAIYYYNPANTTNQWMLSRPVIVVIGKHVFCS